MSTPNLANTTPRGSSQTAPSLHSTEIAPITSGVSWGAIFAGAVAAAALSLILLMLGTGLGLSSVSPWSNQGASTAAIGMSTILWLTFTQIAASGVGGYLAGRLRTKWTVVQTDEICFRDTTHGFITWAVATLLTAALLTTTISSIVTRGGEAAASVADTVASAGGAVVKNAAPSLGENMDYFVDALFRKDMSASSGSFSAQSTGSEINSANSTSEVIRIFSNGIRTKILPSEDKRYVAQLVAQRTGMAQADAEKRVTAIFDKVQAKLKEVEVTAKESADKVRKASSYAAFWFSASWLFGAFFGSLGAMYGGRRQGL